MTLVVLAIAWNPAVQAGTKINLGVVNKPGSAQNIVAGKFKELVEKRSQGRIKVKIHHSASLTRHVYSAHIDVASLAWWKAPRPADQEMIQKAMREAAVQ